MNPNTKYTVTASISNGEVRQFFTDDMAQVTAWKAGVTCVAQMMGLCIRFTFKENEAPRWVMA